MQSFMQSLWIYPEDTEVLGVACKSLLKALKPCYQKIALFSPIDGGCEGFWECYGLSSLEFHSAIDKQKALELVSAAQEELLFETILKRYDELQTTHDFVINLGYAPKFFLNALLDLNTTLAKHLNAPIVAVAQTSLEYLKAMHFHAIKKACWGLHGGFREGGCDYLYWGIRGKLLGFKRERVRRLRKFRDRFAQAHQRQSGQRISGFEPA